MSLRQAWLSAPAEGRKQFYMPRNWRDARLSVFPSPGKPDDSVSTEDPEIALRNDARPLSSGVKPVLAHRDLSETSPRVPLQPCLLNFVPL